MKKVMLFTWDNCTSCAKVKQEIQNNPDIKKRLDIMYYNHDDDKSASAFSKYRIMSIPTMFEIKDWKEVEWTKQVWIIDLTKY